MMVYPFIPLPTPNQIVSGKVWDLVDYFSREFPKSRIKIEVEYNKADKYCVVKELENES